MKPYVVLLRGVNVGGKNKMPMAELKVCLEKLGFVDVKTYIASGNVVLRSDKSPAEIKEIIEQDLPKNFESSGEAVKVLILSHDQLQNVVDSKPKGFGEDPETYYSDAVFLIDLDIDKAMAVFNPREGVDKVWAGKGVVYSQRLGELRVKSRLSKIVGTAAYKSMTIRTWGTVTKLLAIIDTY